MRVVLDTNVLLDVLLNRPGLVHDSSVLFGFAEHKRYVGLVVATSLPTVHYIVEKARDREVALRGIGRLLRLFEVASVGRAEVTIEATADAGFGDYEDGVVHAAAVAAQADAIVTRNEKDFAASMLPVYTPAEMLAVLSNA
ncbi:MAG: PIN domain nuclease [Rubricoccaceae bacterium]